MKTRTRLWPGALLTLAGIGALSIGAGDAFAASDVFNLTGSVANFQYTAPTPYPYGVEEQNDDNYLPLDSVMSTIVSQGDNVTVNLTLDQSYTIAGSQDGAFVLLYLQGNNFDGTSTGDTGTFTFYNGGQVVGTYDSSAGSAEQISSFAVVPNMTPITFDSLTDTLTVTTLDAPVTVTSAALDIQVLSNISAAPEPSTWFLMIAGVAGIGLMLRRAKPGVGIRLKGALPV
jgi:hypothetical protein